MTESTASPSAGDLLGRLVRLVERLRAPDGCPWDREQDLSTVRSYLLEEAHEAAAAIDRGDWPEIAAELGDLLFQVAFVLCLAAEQRAFTPSQVVDETERKMIERHPHVFGDPAAADPVSDAAGVARAWEKRKLGALAAGDSLLDGVAPTLPALVAALRLSQKAAGVGFDWPETHQVLDKIDEESAELRELVEVAAPPDGTADAHRSRLADEIGDLLFALVNLARKLDVDPEAALAGTNLKFRRRFASIERTLTGQGRRLTDAELDELDRLWNEAKRDE